MNLILDKIRFRNILSYGNKWTEFKLNENKINLIWAPNGEGKSAIIDAIYFGLTGKSYRKINKPQLVNTINKKNLMVEIHGHSKNNKYTIRRGINPNIFEIYKNNILIDEDSHVRDYQHILENVLGINHKVIKHTIIMSSRFYIPFLELTKGDKREFIENILSITIFSIMKELLKRKKITLKQKKLSLEKDTERIESNIKILNDINKKQKEELEEQKRSILNQIEILNNEIENCVTNAVRTKDQIKDKQEFLNKVNEKIKLKDKVLKRINQLRFRENEIKRKIEYFINKDLCLECEQSLSQEYKENKIKSSHKLLNQILEKVDSFEKIFEKFKVLFIKQEKIEKEIQDLNVEIAGFENKIDFNKEREKELKEEINNLKNPEYNLYDKENFENEKKDIENKIRQLKKIRRYINITLKILSEQGIKKYILNKYIPLLNKFVNDYLEVLDAPYRIRFDNELNEEIIARGYEKLSYGNFSSGEKQRIDLSLLFTFLNLSKMKNSINTNLLILDEVLDQSLDEQGINNVFKILQELKKNGYTIFVVSHRNGIEDFFDKTYIIEKKRFSEIKEDI